MPMKSYNPTTPSRRFMSVVSREEITKQTPEKSLVVGKKRTGGRNSEGLVSSRFRGGGAIGSDMPSCKRCASCWRRSRSRSCR